MACVGYLLAGLPPHTQSARRGRLRSAYDAFFVPVRAVLHTTRLRISYGRPGKAVSNAAHMSSPTHSKPTNVWGTRANAWGTRGTGLYSSETDLPISFGGIGGQCDLFMPDFAEQGPGVVADPIVILPVDCGAL